MKKRDYINEIVSIKSRSRLYGREEWSGRTFLIDMALKDYSDNQNQNNSEFLRYIPIATVACFESFLRTIIAELIEEGKPYIEKVSKFNHTTNVKFDFNIINAIKDEKISVGEFIAHFLSCNNLKDFNSHISTLLDVDLLDEIKDFQAKGLYEKATSYSRDFRNNFTKILQSVNKTFELRHIFCHEFATNVEIDYKEIIVIYEDCKLYLNQVNEYIYNLIDPDAPETQAGLNDKAKKKFNESEAELNALIIKLKSLEKPFWQHNEIDSEFDKLHQKWVEYREAKANFSAMQVTKATVQPLITFLTLKEMTDIRIKELKKEIDEIASH